MSTQPFKFGDRVDCRSFDGEWMSGFRFLAYVPEMERPFLVKGGEPTEATPAWPIRAHKECRPTL